MYKGKGLWGFDVVVVVVVLKDGVDVRLLLIGEIFGGVFSLIDYPTSVWLWRG